MSLPPDAHDELDDRYRRASERDASRPGEAVRRRVLEYAAQLAAQRAGIPASLTPTSVPRRRSPWWRPAAAFGALAAAIVAGLVIAPRFLIAPVSPTAHAPALAVHAEPGEHKLAAESARPALQSYSAPVVQSPPPAATAGQRARESLLTPPRAAKSVEPVQLASASAADARYADAAEAASGAPAGVPTEQVSVTAARRAAVAPAAANVTDPAAAFRRAAEAGDLGALDRLLGIQPDINARDAAGRTPLMLAVLHGQTGAVSALLAYGADPNAADRRGTTPLQAARAAGRPAIIAALQRYGAQ